MKFIKKYSVAMSYAIILILIGLSSFFNNKSVFLILILFVVLVNLIYVIISLRKEK